MPTKATKTIKQALSYKPQHAAWFEQTQALFNCVVGFYFEVIQAHQLVLELSSKEAFAALPGRQTCQTAIYPKRKRYSEVDAIVVNAPDRLSRNSEQYHTLVAEMQEHNIKVIVAQE